MKTVGPRQKIPFAIITPGKNEILVKESIEVEVSYKNKIDAIEPRKQRFPIDFAYFRELSEVRETERDQLRKIASSLAEIEKQLRDSG